MPPFTTLQGAFTSGELSPSLTARIDLSKYSQGCKTLSNFLVQPHGGAVKRPGFLLMDLLPWEAALLPFVFNASQAYCLVFGQYRLRIANAEGMILGENGAPYEIYSPYTLEQAKTLSFAQSGDVLFLACQGVVPHKLKRLGHESWEFEPMSFTCPISAPESVSGQGYNQAQKSDGSAQAWQLVTPYEYVVTAVSAAGKESEASKGWAFTGPSSNNWAAGDYIRIAWSAVEGAEEYRVYKKEFGGRPGYLASTGALFYCDYNSRPLLSDGPPKWKDPFPDEDYPAVVCFFEQRLVFAATARRPQTIWMSKTGDYDNFSSSVPLKADDSLDMTIAANEVSSIRWMLPLRSLILGGAGMEWELASSEGAFTAKTAKVTPQSYRGSAALRALVVGNILLHVARSGREVRDLKYDFGADSYGGTDRTILAAHLFEDRRITSWTYQPSPDSIIWAACDDGSLLGMTFQPEHEVYAWHRHHTDGQFLCVCSVPGNDADTLFAVVRRGDRYCLEVMSPRMRDRGAAGLGPTRTGGGRGAEPSGGEKDVAASVHLDSAMQYRGAAVTSLSGLEHLEGKRVGILADGAVQAEREVTDGKITLDGPASVVTVGLPYTADLETMPVEVAGEGGSSVGRKKYINAVNVLFRNTVTAKIGCSFSRLEELPWRTMEPYGQPPVPYSGARRVIVPERARNMAGVCVRSDAPLPMTVLAIMPEVEVK